MFLKTTFVNDLLINADVTWSARAVVWPDLRVDDLEVLKKVPETLHLHSLLL